MKILKFEEFINEMLWRKSILRSENGGTRAEEREGLSQDDYNIYKIFKPWFKKEEWNFIDSRFDGTRNIMEKDFPFNKACEIRDDILLELSKQCEKISVDNIHREINYRDNGVLFFMNDIFFIGCLNDNRRCIYLKTYFRSFKNLKNKLIEKVTCEFSICPFKKVFTDLIKIYDNWECYKIPKKVVMKVLEQQEDFDNFICMM